MARRCGLRVLVLRVLALGALACGLAVPAEAGRRFTFRIEDRRDDAPKPVLEVHNPSGRIALAPSPSGRILLEGDKIVEAARWQRAEQLARLTRVRVEEGSDVWRLDIDVPPSMERQGFLDALFGRRERVEADLRLQVPVAARIVLVSESADVDGRDLGGPVQVRTGSGDVVFVRVRGDVRVETGSGDVSLEGVDGDVHLSAASGEVRLRGVTGGTDVETSSGDVDAADLRGDAHIQTLSGDLRLEGCGGSFAYATASGSGLVQGVHGSIDIKSASGDIEVECEPGPGRHFSVETASGAVSLRLLGGGPFAIDAYAAHGELVARLPGLTVVKRTENELVGHVGSSQTPPVRIRSASGNIRVWGEGAPARSPER